MLKILIGAFTGILGWAHFADLPGRPYYRPLSMFRDIEPTWVGKVLFLLLLAIGLHCTWAAFRARQVRHSVIYLLVTVLLGIVAVTPSLDVMHLCVALLAMGTLFLYFASLLFAREQWLGFLLHLSMPTLLVVITRADGYGIWQKSMILYLLFCVLLHERSLQRWIQSSVQERRRDWRVWLGRRRQFPPAPPPMASGMHS